MPLRTCEYCHKEHEIHVRQFMGITVESCPNHPELNFEPEPEKIETIDGVYMREYLTHYFGLHKYPDGSCVFKVGDAVRFTREAFYRFGTSFSGIVVQRDSELIFEDGSSPEKMGLIIVKAENGAYRMAHWSSFEPDE